jgi:hypothetical protein
VARHDLDSLWLDVGEYRTRYACFGASDDSREAGYSVKDTIEKQGCQRVNKPAGPFESLAATLAARKRLDIPRQQPSQVHDQQGIERVLDRHA